MFPLATTILSDSVPPMTPRNLLVLFQLTVAQTLQLVKGHSKAPFFLRKLVTRISVDQRCDGSAKLDVVQRKEGYTTLTANGSSLKKANPAAAL